MARKRLNFNDHDKDWIVSQLTNKLMNVTELANNFGCHPRSINRVMEERGIAAITSRGAGTSDAKRLKELLKKHQLTVDGLEVRLQLPLLTPENVQAFLNNCSKQELASYFYASGLAKLAEIARRQQVAALFQQPAGPAAAQSSQPTSAVVNA